MTTKLTLEQSRERLRKAMATTVTKYRRNGEVKVTKDIAEYLHDMLIFSNLYSIEERAAMAKRIFDWRKGHYSRFDEIEVEDI